MAKAGGNYLSSTLISQEAKANGFHEGIALATDGTVSEGCRASLDDFFIEEYAKEDGEVYKRQRGIKSTLESSRKQLIHFRKFFARQFRNFRRSF